MAYAEGQIMPYWRTPNRPQTVVNLIWGVVLAGAAVAAGVAFILWLAGF
jgi:hypothetical protein